MSAPLFRVFHQGVSRVWTVCPVNLEGEPVGTHSEHADLDDALHEASRANRRFSHAEED